MSNRNARIIFDRISRAKKLSISSPPKKFCAFVSLIFVVPGARSRACSSLEIYCHFANFFSHRSPFVVRELVRAIRRKSATLCAVGPSCAQCFLFLRIILTSGARCARTCKPSPAKRWHPTAWSSCATRPPTRWGCSASRRTATAPTSTRSCRRRRRSRSQPSPPKSQPPRSSPPTAAPPPPPPIFWTATATFACWTFSVASRPQVCIPPPSSAPVAPRLPRVPAQPRPASAPPCPPPAPISLQPAAQPWSWTGWKRWRAPRTPIRSCCRKRPLRPPTASACSASTRCCTAAWRRRPAPRAAQARSRRPAYRRASSARCTDRTRPTPFRPTWTRRSPHPAMCRLSSGLRPSSSRHPLPVSAVHPPPPPRPAVPFVSYHVRRRSPPPRPPFTPSHRS